MSIENINNVLQKYVISFTFYCNKLRVCKMIVLCRNIRILLILLLILIYLLFPRKY